MHVVYVCILFNFLFLGGALKAVLRRPTASLASLSQSGHASGSMQGSKGVILLRT